MKLKIGYLYKNQLNLYGDNGNIEILVKRAQDRNIGVEVEEVGLNTALTPDLVDSFDIVFMGGGPDSEQKNIYSDLVDKKGPYLKEFVENGGFGLYICGSYQLMGNYYKSSDGSILEGLGIFDLHTEHFGPSTPRCIGNTYSQLNDRILKDPYFTVNNKIGNTIVGFENHGGRTFLKNKENCLSKVVVGHGNNSKDKTEGIYYKNSIGTYYHGPFLSRNPHIADFLIAKSLQIDKLKEIDDSLIVQAHTASLNLKQ